MKLTRKLNAPIVKDTFGIEHPEIVIKIIALPEDKLSKWLIIQCGYFHNNLATKSLELFGYNNFEFTFNSNTWEENGMVWETYEQIKQDISIDDNGNIVLLNQNVPNWILNQPWILDFEGKKFSENWEMIN
jgi:hypothetical protein